MNTRVMPLAAAAALVFVAPPTIAQNGGDTFRFGADLSGQQEVTPPDAPTTPSPGVTTQATGTLQLAVLTDLSSLDYTISVQNGVGVTASHLHCGRAGENGPVVAFLSPANVQGAEVNGVLGQGTITNANIEATATDCEELIGRPVRNIASLAEAAVLGLIYVNVHTVANPEGEIRGQVLPGFNPSSAPPRLLFR